MQGFKIIDSVLCLYTKIIELKPAKIAYHFYYPFFLMNLGASEIDQDN